MASTHTNDTCTEPPATITEADLERARVECVFGLGGGEMHVADERFPDRWDGVIAYWYDGPPEYVTLDELGLDLDDEVRTAIVCGLYGMPEAPEEWTMVASYSSSGEAACWWCGDGAGDGEADETDDGHEGCPLCEGDGVVYIGDGWQEVVYIRRAT